MTLAEKLNEKGAYPVVMKGQVTDLNANDGRVHYSLSDFSITEGYLNDHPEGSDRGGYVPYVTTGSESAYYMENDGEWHDG